MNRRSFLATLLGAAATALLAPRLLAAGPQLCGSAKAAAGWLCTRPAGHTGPCAAVSNGEPSGVQFLQRVQRPLDPGGYAYSFKCLEVPKSLEYAKALIGAGKQAA